MTAAKPLLLYEEVLLLSLRNRTGTTAAYPEHAIAGAILAELLISRRITIEDPKKRWVVLQDATPLGDPIIDQSLESIATAKRRGSLTTWISRLACGKKHKVAAQLCSRGIVRAVDDKVLLIFSRKVYPEVDPIPEKQIVERLRSAIFDDRSTLDPRTVVLVSLAHGAGLLDETFGRKEIKARKQRIEQIANGELTGKATQEVIAAAQAAMMIAAIMPSMIAATSSQ
jgi:hypothetical protein